MSNDAERSGSFAAVTAEVVHIGTGVAHGRASDLDLAAEIQMAVMLMTSEELRHLAMAIQDGRVLRGGRKYT